MHLSDFHFELPQELIAYHPPATRREARLLILDGRSGAIRDAHFTDVLGLLNPGDLLVFNDTRVIPARIVGRKPSGGRVELLIEKIIDSHTAIALVKASKPPALGSVVIVADRYELEVIARDGGRFHLSAEPGVDISQLLEQVGQVPLPPYIRRPVAAHDRERYQTIYARASGAVAAPTAGLHFDQALMQELAAHGVETGFLTLHVGPGTFAPIHSEQIEDHRMHSEYFAVDELICRQVNHALENDNRIIAVGTTSVRALESAWHQGRLRPQQGETSIYIYPGYKFRVVDALITNFHLPASTLMLLVSAFAGREAIMAAYRHAIDKSYRFLSYGDAMWLLQQSGASAKSMATRKP